MNGTNGERVLLQVLVTMEVLQEIRVRAVLARVPPGRVIEAAIHATNGTNGGMKPMAPMVKATKPAKKPAEAKPKVKAKPTVAAPVGDEWTQEKVKEAMEKVGLRGRTLAEKLVSKHGTPPSYVIVNRWCRGAEKVPRLYWGQLDRIFGGGK